MLLLSDFAVTMMTGSATADFLHPDALQCFDAIDFRHHDVEQH